MRGRAKLAVVGVSVLGAAVVWLSYTRAAVFGPGWTPQLLVGLEREAKRTARQERAT